MCMQIFKKKLVLIISGSFLIFGLLIFSGYYFFAGKGSEYEYVAVKKADINQEVSVTGKVKPASSANLAFEKSGKVVRIDISIGDQVYVGQVLMVQDNADTVAQLAQAEAKLAELQKGTRAEEVQVEEVKVANAKSSLADAKKNLVDKIQDSYAKADDAIRNKSDQFFNNPKTSNPLLSFTPSNTQLKSDLEWQRTLIETKLVAWKNSVDGTSVMSDMDSKLKEASDNMSVINSFLEKAASAVNSLLPSSTLTQTTIDGWKADMSTSRTNVNTSINALSVAEEKMRTATSSLTLAEQNLTLAKAGTVSEQIKAQEAVVAQYEAQLAKTILRSPINGIITERDVELGEIVTANANIVSVISEAQFEIETNIPEADIAKIKIGNTARVTLDAYGSDTQFPAVVTKINPAETVIEGVSTYKTTLQFVNKDNRIRSGMTANLDIVTAQKSGVLVVPQRAVSGKGGEKFILVNEGDAKSPVERKVTTGLKGTNGEIEIISGAQEGEMVVGYQKSN